MGCFLDPLWFPQVLQKTLIGSLQNQEAFPWFVDFEETAGQMSEQYSVLLEFTTSPGNTDTGEAGPSQHLQSPLFPQLPRGGSLPAQSHPWEVYTLLFPRRSSATLAKVAPLE